MEKQQSLNALLGSLSRRAILNYPDKLCVLSPHIVTFRLPTTFGGQQPAVYLRALATLTIIRGDNGRFSFHEMFRHDEDGSQSVNLLMALCDVLDVCEASPAAFHLKDLADALVRVPEGSELKVSGKAALIHFRNAMLRQPIDAASLDQYGGMPTLQRTALAHDLPAEWDKPSAGYNPTRLRSQLTARSQAMWLAIAADRLPPDQMLIAEEYFLAWKSEQIAD